MMPLGFVLEINSVKSRNYIKIIEIDIQDFLISIS